MYLKYQVITLTIIMLRSESALYPNKLTSVKMLEK